MTLQKNKKNKHIYIVTTVPLKTKRLQVAIKVGACLVSSTNQIVSRYATSLQPKVVTVDWRVKHQALPTDSKNAQWCVTGWGTASKVQRAVKCDGNKITSLTLKRQCIPKFANHNMNSNNSNLRPYAGIFIYFFKDE